MRRFRLVGWLPALICDWCVRICEWVYGVRCGCMVWVYGVACNAARPVTPKTSAQLADAGLPADVRQWHVCACALFASKGMPGR